MKKLLAIFVLLSLLLLSGCEWFSEEEPEIGFFDEALLTECKLTEIPMPNAEDVRHNGGTVYCNMTDEERVKYADDIAAFLLAKEDIYYKGYHAETGCPGGIFFLIEYRFAPLTAESDHGGWFAFSLTEKLNEGDEYNYSYWNGVTVSVGMKEGQIGSYSYNTVIKIDNDPHFITYLRPEHTEHTYGYYKDETGHCWYYTCECVVEPNFEPHYDDNGDGKCDECEYDMGTAEPRYFFLHRYEGWLLELEAEDIAEIKTTFEYVGIAPGSLKDISRTTDKTVIKELLENFAYTSMTYAGDDAAYPDGGSAFTIEFTLTDGTVKKLFFNNCLYEYASDQPDGLELRYFVLDSIPTLEGHDNVTQSRGFISYVGMGTVYDKDDNPVCEIPIDELEFVEFDGNVDAVVTGYYYTVETEFGTVWFDYSNDLFYLSFAYGEDDYREYYRLVGKNLDQLIAEYGIDNE